jgi:TP901 family phage tail tape measure protein
VATPDAILSVLVEANTAEATAKLTKYERELEKANAVAKKGIETRLGASYDPKAFAAYEAATKKAMDRTANRAAFKAELGANFSPAGFRAYQRALDQQAASTEHAKEKTAAFSEGIGGVGSKLMGVAAFATGASLGLGEIAKSSLDAQVKFQSSMELIRTQAHQTQGEVNTMSKSVEALGPAVGTSAQELAKGLYHIESQGLHSTKALNALRVAAEGAKIGNANLEDVTNALGATLVSGAKGTGSMRGAMGQLNAIVGAGDMRMQDLANALGTGLLGPMKQFGVSLQDVGGALAVFGDNNIRGQDAATKLGSAIRIMAAPSKAAAKELGTIGIGATQLADDIRQKGLVAAFEDLKKHLVDSGLTASQQALVLSRAFGGRQATGVQLLVGQLDRLKSKTEDIGKGAGKFGSDWQATTHTLGFQLEKTKSTFESLALVIGKAIAPIIPIIGKIAGGILKFVEQMQRGTGAGGKFAKILGDIFRFFKSIVGPVIQFLGGIKTVLLVVLALTAALVALAAVLAVIDLLTSPLTLVFIAIAVAALLIIKYWKPIKAFFIDLWQSIEDAAKPVVEWLKGAWGDTAKAFTDAWQAAISWLSGAFDSVSGVFKPLIDSFTQGIQSIEPAVSEALGAVTGIFSTFFTIMTPLFDVFIGQINAVIDLLSGAFTTTFQIVKTLVGSAMTQIGIYVTAGWAVAKAAFELAEHVVKTVIDTIAGIVRGGFQIIKGVLEVFSGLFTLDFGRMWQGIEDIFGGALKIVVSIVRGQWGIIKAAGTFLMQGLQAGINAVWGTIKNFVSTIIDSIVSIVSGAWNAMYTAGKSILEGVMQGFRDAASTVLGVVVGFINDIIDVVNWLITKIGMSKIGHVTNPLAGGGSSSAPSGQGGVGHSIPGHAAGGMVTAPGYFAGEEAPQHPEFILATNPKYRDRNLKLFVQAGKALGIAGYAQGGTFSYGQLESLWTGAGGSPSIAPTMAAIALAESGGGQYAHNPSGASGLWQILGQLVPGNIYDPHINALNAVAKYRSQGLGAWTTYTNGSYRHFLGGAQQGGGGGGGIFDTIFGAIGGTISDLLGGVLDKLPKAPKLAPWISGLPGFLLDKAGGFVKKTIEGLFSGGGGSTNASGIAGTSLFDSYPVAKWIVPILDWARTHGWAGTVTSGYRTKAQQLSAAAHYGLEHYGPGGPLGSNHLKTVYPGGAVDVTAAAQLAAVLRGYPGRPNLVWGGPVMGDWVHFSATGHRMGGIAGRYAGAFANGGAVTASSPTMAIFGEHGPETAVFIPGYAYGGRRPHYATGHHGYRPPRHVPPVRLAPLAPGVSGAVTGEPAPPSPPPLNAKTLGTIAVADAIASKISGFRDRISGLTHTYSILGGFFGIAPETLIDPNTGEVDQAALSRRLAQLDQLIAIRQQIFDLWGQVVAYTQNLIVSYKAVLTLLRGTLPWLHGPGQQKQRTKIQGQITSFAGRLSSAVGDLTSARDDRDQAWLDLLTDRNTRAGVAATQATPATVAATPPTTDTIALLTTLLTQSQQTLAVSQAQYSVLRALPPFGGSFAAGGVVPGPAGMPRTIIAHGGERVGGAPEVHLHIAPGMEFLRDLIQVEIKQSGRRDSRYAARALPGGR